jgi:hypothetical protein
MNEQSRLVPTIRGRGIGAEPAADRMAATDGEAQDVSIAAELEQLPHAQYRMTSEQALKLIYVLIAAFGPNRWCTQAAQEFYIFHLRQLDFGVARKVINEITSSGDPFPPTAGQIRERAYREMQKIEQQEILAGVLAESEAGSHRSKVRPELIDYRQFGRRYDAAAREWALRVTSNASRGIRNLQELRLENGCRDEAYAFSELTFEESPNLARQYAERHYERFDVTTLPQQLQLRIRRR